MTPRAMLARLVAFPTVSQASNLDPITLVCGWLARRAVLSGHGDGMPVAGRDWTSDPLTQAGQSQPRGLSTVIRGPGAGGQAHQPEASVTTDQLDAGAAFMAGPIARLAA